MTYRNEFQFDPKELGNVEAEVAANQSIQVGREVIDSLLRQGEALYQADESASLSRAKKYEYN